VQGTPFAHVLKASETEVRLTPAGANASLFSAARVQSPQERVPLGQDELRTEVTIELRQALNGFFPRFGGYMVGRAARSTVESALDGLERISG
jgi:hypothetical protein